MKPRFEPNPDAASTREAQRLIDPEAFEASEQQFAASLESMELLSAARFVVDHAPGDVTGFPAEPPDSSASKQRQSPAEEQPYYTTHSETSSRDLDLDAAGDPSAWRQAVAARLNRYRQRRQPRAPRYPSLRLRFEPAQPDWTARDNTEVPTPSRQSVAEDSRQVAISAEPKSQNLTEKPLPAKLVAAEATAKIIEFPRSAAPPRPLDELAEPVLDRPRILEAPEIVPAAPALGGILIEAAEEEPADRRPGFEIPLQAARLARRIGAAATDVLTACTPLSGLSLGLGFAWCMLDEDELCWHDRITHTYMAPKS